MTGLAGKIVLVTGATSGIGEAAAIALAAAGAHLVCAARREDRGIALAERLRATGATCDFVATDIGDADSIAALFEAIRQRHGRLDGALNNAGIEVPHAPLADLPVERLDEAWSVNVRGTFLCMQEEMRMMRAQGGGGAIVNTASTGGILGLQGSAAYVASKHAVVGLSRAGAMDGAADNIRVNVICPSATWTEMMQRWTGGSDEIAQRMGAIVPLDRVAQPAEMAQVALWLLSDAASYVTGVVMPVDGGLSAGVRV